MRLSAITALLVLAVLGLLIARYLMRASVLVAPMAVDTSFTSEAEVPIEGRRDLVVDPQLGHRLPRRAAWDVPGGTRRTNDLGLVREQDLGGEIPGPRILWLASDLLAGVPNADAAPNLIERALRDDGVWTTATVLDATTAGDDLWLLARRGRALAARYQPTLVLAAVAVDRDLTAPAANQQPLQLAIEDLLSLAPRRGGTLLVILVPDRTLLDVPLLARQNAIRLRQLLQALHVSTVDLTDSFAAKDATSLYLPDGRLGPLGQRRLADAALPRVRRILDSL